MLNKLLLEDAPIVKVNWKAEDGADVEADSDAIAVLGRTSAAEEERTTVGRVPTVEYDERLLV